jgi:hypothetical protein
LNRVFLRFRVFTINHKTLESSRYYLRNVKNHFILKGASIWSSIEMFLATLKVIWSQKRVHPSKLINFVYMKQSQVQTTPSTSSYPHSKHFKPSTQLEAIFKSKFSSTNHSTPFLSQPKEFHRHSNVDWYWKRGDLFEAIDTCATTRRLWH